VSETVDRRRFLGLAGGAGAGLVVASWSWSGAPAQAATVAHRYEYVFTTGTASVYDMDHGHRLVTTLALGSDVIRIRGACFSPVTGQLYVSYLGPTSDPGTHGYLLRYDLARRARVWRHTFAAGQVDSMDITPDGLRIYLPTGATQTQTTTWRVLRGWTGAQVAEVAVALQPHDTVVSLDGKEAYLGAIGSEYLWVLDTATNRIVRKVGPLGAGGPPGGGGVHPFTINGRHTRTFVSVLDLLGFVVADLVTGKLLFRVDLTKLGFSWPDGPTGEPSHGVSLSPDETELYVIDKPNNMVHVFAVTGVTATPPIAPRLVASIALQGSLTGTQSTGAPKEGWVQHSLDGRFVYVGDAGDVINTSTRTTALVLNKLADTRISLEIDFDASGHPIATSSRTGIGRVA